MTHVQIGVSYDEQSRRAVVISQASDRPAAGIRRRPDGIVGWPTINRILDPIELAADARVLDLCPREGHP